MDAHRRTLPPFPALFQDRRYLVIDKPAGLPVHATRRGGPNAEDMLRAWLGARDGPWLAHRLDTDTAGCLLIALRRSALRAAQAAFTSGTVRKTYWAAVAGAPPQDEGTIDAPLIRRERNGAWRMEVDPAGQPARTAWRLCGRSADITWLELAPATGRTHQIRAHCAALGCPVLGDPVYGDGPHSGPGSRPLHLLARALALPLTPPVAATAPVPAHMRAALAACGWQDA